MSVINQLGALAFAAGALAIPQHGHGHHYHHAHRSGSASGSGMPFPYPGANSTGLWGTTGTGLTTGTAAPNSYSSPSSASVHVVTVSPLPASPSSAASSVTSGDAASGAGTTTCTTDVTVTTTERTYVTVTMEESSSSSIGGPSTSHVTVQSTVYLPSSASSAVSAGFSSASVSAPSGPAAYTPQTASSASSSSSNEVSPVASSETASSSSSTASSSMISSSSSSSSSSAAQPSSYATQNKQYTWHHPDATSSAVPSSYVAPSSSSVFVAPTTSSETSVYVAPTSSSSTYDAPTTSSSSSAATTPSSYPSSGSGGKRGLAYNDASLTSCFMDSPHVGWAYNWGSDNGGFQTSSSVNYIPLLWSTRSDFTSGWSTNAQKAIDAGSTHLFSFNEPDLSTQANMSPEDAASAWKQYMEPFAGKAKLCAPSVTNGGGSMGLSWLTSFLNACQGCTIDCINIHWYAEYTLADYFKEHVTNATQVGGGRPVFVSEFATTDGSDEDISNFLQDVMPWMDSNDGVAGYAYFMVKDGLLNSGSGPSSFGSTYATYSS